MIVCMSAKRHRWEVVEGLSLPVPNKGTIAHTIISKMEGWRKAAEILMQFPPDLTQNFQSVRVVICQLADAGYLTREHAPYSRGRRGGQSYALTDAGHEVRDYINSPARRVAGSNGQYSSPTTSG